MRRFTALVLLAFAFSAMAQAPDLNRQLVLAAATVLQNGQPAVDQQSLAGYE